MRRGKAKLAVFGVIRGEGRARKREKDGEVKRKKTSRK